MDNSSLPLDWTRITRKRGACCVGSAASTCRHRSNGTDIADGVDDNDRRSGAHSYYKGQVIVCLHESNPDWFQAYFFTDSGETWGLLGVQKDIDECLQCTEGGYRVIDLKLTTSPQRQHNKTTTFRNIEWTGGDMMDLKGKDITMQAEKIYTEAAAVPILEQLFPALLRRVRAETTVEEHEEPMDDVLNFFPELAIVVGEMEMTLPIVAADDDDDDLFGDDP